MAVPASALATLTGVVVGGFAARALARSAGASDDLSAIGALILYIAAGAWCFGVVGCYAALVLLRGDRALRTAAVVASLLPLGGVLSWVVAHGVGTTVGGGSGIALAIVGVLAIIGGIAPLASALVRATSSSGP